MALTGIEELIYNQSCMKRIFLHKCKMSILIDGFILFSLTLNTFIQTTAPSKQKHCIKFISFYQLKTLLNRN